MPTKKSGITLDQCHGCENDFYNGKNPMGIKRCWSFESAEPIKVRMIHVDLRPPYKHIPLETKPSCYQQRRYVKVKPEALTSDGYWKS